MAGLKSYDRGIDDSHFSNKDGTYNPALLAKQNQPAAADKVIANGVTIVRGAKFALRAIVKTTLSAGTVFTVISNTSARPISGTYANLADGAKLKSGGTTFQASYEGGDGNDLMLTVQ